MAVSSTAMTRLGWVCYQFLIPGTAPPQAGRGRKSSVHQETREKGGDAGEHVLTRGGIGSDDRHDAGGSPIFRQLASRQIGAVKAVIRSGINLHLDSGGAARCVIHKKLARRSRCPDVLGAEQN